MTLLTAKRLLCIALYRLEVMSTPSLLSGPLPRRRSNWTMTTNSAYLSAKVPIQPWVEHCANNNRQTQSGRKIMRFIIPRRSHVLETSENDALPKKSKEEQKPKAKNQVHTKKIICASIRLFAFALLVVVLFWRFVVSLSSVSLIRWMRPDLPVVACC